MTGLDHKLLIETDGCAGCPAAAGWRCMAAERMFDDDDQADGIDYPNWCPLLSGYQLVRLRLTR